MIKVEIINLKIELSFSRVELISELLKEILPSLRSNAIVVCDAKVLSKRKSLNDQIPIQYLDSIRSIHLVVIQEYVYNAYELCIRVSSSNITFISCPHKQFTRTFTTGQMF